MKHIFTYKLSSRHFLKNPIYLQILTLIAITNTRGNSMKFREIKQTLNLKKNIFFNETDTIILDITRYRLVCCVP